MMRQETESKMENCEHRKYLFLGLLLVLQFAPYPMNYSFFCVCVTERLRDSYLVIQKEMDKTGYL